MCTWISRYIEPRRLLYSLTFPIFFTATVVVLMLVWYLFDLPQDAKLMAIGQRLFDTYGYLALFVSGILEGALIVGLYYPGAFVIFLSVFLAGPHVGKLATLVVVVSLAFMIGLSIDYLLGRYGWYRLLVKLGFRHEIERAQIRLNRYGGFAIFLTYWDANIASFTATAAGILRYPYRRFLLYSLIALFAWDTFWTIVLLVIGRGALALVGGHGGYVLLVIGVWTLCITGKHVYDTTHHSKEAQVAMR